MRKDVVAFTSSIKSDEKLLEDADQTWRELVAAQTPPEHDAAKIKELDRIVDAAKSELLSSDG